MKILSLKKYLTYAFLYLTPFIFIMGISILLHFTDAEKYSITIAVVRLFSILGLLMPALYYFYMYFKFKIKCKKISPITGVIANWQHGFVRYTGSVIIKINDTEYSTSAYFNYDDAKDLVGKSVKCAIIDETLIIYEILD